MSLAEGVPANHALLTIINDLIGKEVLVEAIDGNKYSGIFAACSTEFDIGLRYAHEITVANKKNLLPKRSDIIEKLQFKFGDIVAMSALLSEEKVIKGFATDRDYHSKQQNGRLGDGLELQEWEGDDESEDNESIDQQMPDQRQRYQRNGGWSVDDMFSANSQLGVQSTFNEDLRQYTTADVEGNEEDRRRADIIAKEIEGNAQSKFHARLENDDDERDLDKATTEDDFELQGRRGQRGNFNNRNGRNGAGSTVTNRRAEVLKGMDRRGSGTQSRYNSTQNQGSYNTPQQSKTMYNNPQGTKYEKRDRPTGQELQESFQEWTNSKDCTTTGRKDQGGSGVKIYENTNFNKGQKVLLEPANRSNASSRGPSLETKGVSHGGAARRVDNLREWNQEFSNNYRGTRNDSSSNENKSDSPPRTVTTGNAWAKGPPTSVISVQNSQAPASLGSDPNPPESTLETSDEQPTDTAIERVSQNEAVVVTTTTPSPPPPPPPPPAATTTTTTTTTSLSLSSTTTSSSSESNTNQPEKEEQGAKKFSFNPNAPAFTPRVTPSTPTPQQSSAPPQTSQSVMGGVPIGPVPTEVPMQSGIPPPGMIPAMQAGQPTAVMMPWQGAPAQAFQVPGGYQYVVGGQPVNVMASQPMPIGGPRPGATPTVAFAQGNPRRPGAVMVPHSAAQWQPQMMQVGQGMVPYAYQSFQVQGAGAAVPPPQQFGGPQQQMVAGAQHQQPAPPVYQQRAFLPAQVGYVLPQSGVPGQSRFPTPQQTPHPGIDSSHYQGQGAQGSAASTGPNSQPPTPGPQPVPSPAQGGGRTQSPAPQPGPPPAQQFMAAPTGQPHHMAHPQHFYAQPMYGVYSGPGGQGMVLYGGPGGVPVAHVQSAHHDQPPHIDGIIQTGPPQQYMSHDNYGNYVQAPFYQQPPPNQMSRQSSTQQSVYNSQSIPGVPPQQQPQQGPPQQQ